MLNEIERSLLIEAEAETELPLESATGPGLRLDADTAQAVADPLVEQGYLRHLDPDAYEITPKGQELVIEMVGMR